MIYYPASSRWALCFKIFRGKNNLERTCTCIVTDLLQEFLIPHEPQGRPASSPSSGLEKPGSRYMHLDMFPSSPLKLFSPSCSISPQDESATCSSNLAPSTGPLWYQFPYGFTRSRNPGSPRFISPTCFECHISWARGHTRTCPCAHKRAHSCALPFHCRHNSQFWLCASLIPLPVSERHVNQRREAASSAVHVCSAAAPTSSVSVRLLLPASVLSNPSLLFSGPFPCQSMHSSLTHLTSSWCSLPLIAS